MSEELADRPTPTPDPEPERAPGGADASITESDVGAASNGQPVTPDPPLNAQQDEEDVPDEVQEPETPDITEEPEEEGTSEPSA